MDLSVHKESLQLRLRALKAAGVQGGTYPSLQARAIRRALTRLDRGEFGYCRICGADIPLERLDLMPENPHCESCAG